MTTTGRKTSTIAIVGSGEMGIQALHIINMINGQERTYDIVGWIDDTKETGTEIKGVKVIGNLDAISCMHRQGKFDCLFVAIGYHHLAFKMELIERHKREIPFANIISPNAIVDPEAVVGSNVMVYPGAIIDKGCSIGDGVTVNLGSIISHDTTIGQGSFIAPGATLAGFCEIGECCFIGAGSTIIDNTKICSRCTIGAGSVLTRDLATEGTYAGVPARKIH